MTILYKEKKNQYYPWLHSSIKAVSIQIESEFYLIFYVIICLILKKKLFSLLNSVKFIYAIIHGVIYFYIEMRNNCMNNCLGDLNLNSIVHFSTYLLHILSLITIFLGLLDQNVVVEHFQKDLLPLSKMEKRYWILWFLNNLVYFIGKYSHSNRQALPPTGSIVS